MFWARAVDFSCQREAHLAGLEGKGHLDRLVPLTDCDEANFSRPVPNGNFVES